MTVACFGSEEKTDIMIGMQKKNSRKDRQYAHSVTHRVQFFSTLGTIIAHHVPLSMEFSRQEYWSGLLFPTPGDLPDPGIEPTSPASPRVFTTEPPGRPQVHGLPASISPRAGL